MRNVQHHASAVAAVLAGSGCALAAPTVLHAQVVPPDGNAATVFRHTGQGLSFEMQALTLDQMSAFLVGRGFSVEAARAAALRGCFFRSAISHSAEAGARTDAVRINLTRWRIEPAGGAARAPLTREDWDAHWRAAGVSGAPAVAFHWALFPTAQEFGPADHNWGFLTFGLAPGATFALVATWQHDGQHHEQRLEGLSCAR